MGAALAGRLGRARRALPAGQWPLGLRRAHGLRGLRRGEARGALGSPSWGEVAGSGASRERRCSASAGDVAAARGAAPGGLGPVSGGLKGERHLLVMVHGLFGRPRDWRHFVEELQRSGVVGAGGGSACLSAQATEGLALSTALTAAGSG